MTTLVAWELLEFDGKEWGQYWDIYTNENPYDPPVTTVESEDFGDYIAELLTEGYIDDILVNTYESWLDEQALMDHKEYL